ncbi:hypothetical protein AHMF7616_04385 [Adhaeribacter pallidiroseus]|uniref:Uncharacterized protein n=1 Tax=Adhaeribacter pallidiroseus TaxID=2072847 RepID=A0A369QQ03_9BACT|nr:hypothetical protein AHMF7616_04385 [Adhaeribacter pallidiroseus]
MQVTSFVFSNLLNLSHVYPVNCRLWTNNYQLWSVDYRLIYFFNKPNSIKRSVKNSPAVVSG